MGIQHQVLEISVHKRRRPLETGPEEGHKNGRGLKHLSFEVSLGIGVVQSGGEKSMGRPSCDLSKRGLKDEQRFTAKACSDRTGSKGFKCKFLRVLLH